MKYRIRFSIALLLLLSLVVNAQSGETIQSEVKIYMQGTPFPAPTITVPKFPDKRFDVRDFGAKGDGMTKNTSAIQSAIDKCSAEGGGQVIIPAGVWITGAIEMKSNVDLHTERGALIIFSADHRDFLVKRSSSGAIYIANPIYGNGLTNIAFTGEGIFDGNGMTWRPVKKGKLTAAQWDDLVKSGGELNDKKDMWFPSAEARDAEAFLRDKNRNELTESDYEKYRDFYRPHLLFLEKCNTILFSEITIQNSPRFATYLRACDNIIVRKVRVMNEWWAQNGDGLDFSGCKDAILYQCTVNAGDDAICLKSSGNYALENFVIADCIVYHGHGGFVIGSNTDGGMRNVSVKNCTFIGTDTGLRFKSGIGRGGRVENIFISDIYMKDIAKEAITFDLFYVDAGAVKMKDVTVENAKAPTFSGIYIANVICDGASAALKIAGLDSVSINSLSLTNVTIRSSKGLDINKADNLKFEKCTFITNGDMSKLTDVQNSQFKNISFPNNNSICVEIFGNSTKNLLFEGLKSEQVFLTQDNLRKEITIR